MIFQQNQCLGVHMTRAMHEYYLTRERNERAAAERATSDLARAVHTELAERYAALTRDRERLTLRFEAPGIDHKVPA